MNEVVARFNRVLLRIVHTDVRKSFPQIPNLTSACGVTNTMRGQWFAEIDVPTFPRFTWDGKAGSATEARARAWQAFMNKYVPERNM